MFLHDLSERKLVNLWFRFDFFAQVNVEFDCSVTRYCARSKDVQAVEQNGEVYLKSDQIFFYGEFLENVGLK